MTRALILTAVVCAAVASPLHAQIAVGNLYGTVADASGGLLPGVAVTLDGEGVARSSLSGADGRFRLLGLSRGTYTLTLELLGFATLQREVRIVTGENVDLAQTLEVSQQQEVVHVTAETPLVDPRRRGTATTLTADELDRIPTARDPWGVLRNVPGVLTDRVNIAGNESGQQSAIAGKGTQGDQKTWTLDGVEITDMASTGGASSAYYDFGAIDEMQVTTGAHDLRTTAGGIGIHMTVKRGTDAFHGSARALLAHDDLSSSNLPEELRGDPRLQGADKADRIQQIAELGFDLGGPILRDRLWFYASWGRQDIRLLDLTQIPDRTALVAWNARLSWQASPDTQVSGLWFRPEKLKWGRTGWGGTAADSYRWDQKNAATPGGLPVGLWKLQVDHSFSPNLFVSARVAHQDTGFGVFARGAPEQSFTRDYVAGEAFGTHYDYETVRPNTVLGVDGSRFFEGLGGDHELKFGFAYRATSVSSTTAYPGNQLGGVILGPGDVEARVQRDVTLEYSGDFWSAYLGDVYTRGHLTLQLGLRWDQRGAHNEPSDTPANRTFPDVLPGIRYPGDDADIVSWNDLSPRASVSLALDEARSTVARASYALYPGQFPLWQVIDESPMQDGYLAFGWDDLDGDRLVQPGEVRLDDFLYSVNVNPADPGSVTAPGRVDRNLRPQRSHELVLGLDHQLVPDLSVGLAWTWRRSSRFTYRPWRAGRCEGEPTAASCPVVGPESYSPDEPVGAGGFTASTWSPDPALVAAGGYGWLATNWPGYAQEYSGLEATLTRRLSNRWMGRVAFSLNDWVDRFDGTPVGNFGNPTPDRRWPLVDGGQVAGLTGKSGVTFSSVRWQLYANAMLELPWRLELAGAVFGRQGFAYPRFLRLRAGVDYPQQALAQERIDVDRYDDIWDLDLRLAKHVRLGRARLSLSAELFNVFNSGVVLARDGNARASSFDRIEEILSPRILRFGARVSF